MMPSALILRIIGSAVFILAAWYAYHRFTEFYVEVGRVEVLEEMQPKIDALETDKKRLQDAYAQLSDDVTRQNAKIQELKDIAKIKRDQRVQAENKAKGIAQHRDTIINAAAAREIANTCDLAVKQAQKDLR
jgi:hypothetical protein